MTRCVPSLHLTAGALSLAPVGAFGDALRSLKKVLPEAPALQPLRSPKKRAAAGVWSGAVTPLELQRYKREIAPQWRRYLATGDTSTSWVPTSPPQATARSPELGLTRELVWAVGDPKIAWSLVSGSATHRDAEGQAPTPDWWLKYVWNRCVEDAKAFSPRPSPRRVREPPRRGAQRSRPHVSASRTSCGLSRAARARLATPRRPPPARSHADRRRTACSLPGARPGQEHWPWGPQDHPPLRLLDGSVGRLHTDCLSPLEPDSTSFEFEIAPSEDCSEIPH